MTMNIEFSPGPSQTYAKLTEYLQDAVDEGVMSMSHRSVRFADMYARTTNGLRELLDIPQDYHVWFLGSATEAMERIVQNTVERSSHHFVNGAFSEKFASIALQLGKHPTLTEAPWGEGFGLAQEAVPEGAELIAVTQNETSTGVAHGAEGIAQLHDRYPDKLIAVDVVSAVPYMTLDYTKVDCAFFSVQKGFGLPAGLGVLIASPRALARAEALHASGTSIGSYHSFIELAKNEAKHNTPETPNVLAIYLLGRVVADMLAMGAAALREQLAARAALLYAALEQHPHLVPAVQRPEHRSHTVIVAAVKHSPAVLIQDIRDTHGLALGAGYGQQKDTHIRIANFPAHLQHVEILVNALRKHDITQRVREP